MHEKLLNVKNVWVKMGLPHADPKEESVIETMSDIAKRND